MEMGIWSENNDVEVKMVIWGVMMTWGGDCDPDVKLDSERKR